MTFVLWYFIMGTVLTLTCGYIGWRLIHPAIISAALKWILWTALIILALLPLLSYFIGQLGLERISYLFTWAGYIGLGIISFLFFFVIIRDLLLLFSEGGFKLFSYTAHWLGDSGQQSDLFDPERRRFLINTTNLGILGLTSTLTGYGIFEARRKPAVIEYDIKIKNLPPDLDGLRIIQISDIHAGLTVRRNWVKTVVEEVNNLNADIVAFTGDMVDGSVPKLKDDVEPLRNLQARLAKYFITGNHEYYSGALPWVEKAAELGFDVLINENRLLQKGTGRMLIAGVTDTSAGQFIKEHKTNPKAALTTTENNIAARIFLAHQPRSLYESAQYGFDLMLSGHTHGGQFFPWNFLATLGQPYIKGLHQAKVKQGEGWVYVSKGTGYWGPPIRVNARSEIGVFTLKTA